MRAEYVRTSSFESYVRTSRTSRTHELVKLVQALVQALVRACTYVATHWLQLVHIGIYVLRTWSHDARAHSICVQALRKAAIRGPNPSVDIENGYLLQWDALVHSLVVEITQPETAFRSKAEHLRRPPQQLQNVARA